MTSEQQASEPDKRVFIPTPAEIQKELDELFERRRNLLALLKVSRRVYGAATDEEK